MGMHGPLLALKQFSSQEYVLLGCGLLAGSCGLILLVCIFLTNETHQLPSSQGEKLQVVSTQKYILCEVVGAVAHPGVVRLEAGSRVGDAIAQAGGLSKDADVEAIAALLNLAEQIVDGQKITVPTVSSVSTPNVHVNTVSINSATLQELDALSGVGKVTAQKIIDNRPYTTIESIVEKNVISQKVFNLNKEKIRLY